MFTSGQKIFALVFIISFVILIGFQYYKDSKRNKALFKGTYWIILAVISVMIGYVLLNKVLH
jgi:predicted negative regulator of RcsB-dependent stress response